MDARCLWMIADQELVTRAVREDFEDERAFVREADTLDTATDNCGREFIGDGAHGERIEHGLSFPALRAYSEVYTVCKGLRGGTA